MATCCLSENQRHQPVQRTDEYFLIDFILNECAENGIVPADDISVQMQSQINHFQD